LCSNATGRFEVEEIFNFTQEDVEEDDIMLLDTHDSVFIWVGKDANTIERKESMTTALVRNILFSNGRNIYYFLLLYIIYILLLVKVL